MKVYIKTPARLHLGLIDMNGSLGRMFGGLGVGINQPNVVIEAEPADKFVVMGEKADEVALIAKRFFEVYGTKSNIKINVKRTIPAHEGLGSGTQLALAVATALTKVFNLKMSTQELALAMGRCRRTGVGTAIFDRGGFVVDGGKIVKDGNCIPGKFPPLIFSKPFPKEWRFIVAVPRVNKGLNSEKETAAFSQVPSMPSEQVGNLCRLTMLKLLPALIEKDIKNFGDALTQIQITTGNAFVKVQGGTYSSRESEECIRYMQELGVYGVGQSSWGPTIYGVVKKENAKQACVKVQAYLNKEVGGRAFVAKADNKGAQIRVIK